MQKYLPYLESQSSQLFSANLTASLFPSCLLVKHSGISASLCHHSLLGYLRSPFFYDPLKISEKKMH